MGRKSQFEISFPIIESYFDSLDNKSFSEKVFEEIYYEYRATWGIPSSKYAAQFIEFLLRKDVLTIANFGDESKNITKIIYYWKNQDDFTVMSGLKRNSYFTHYSAMFLHQLTLQIPKTYYLNWEHTSNSVLNTERPNLSQESIDKAFSNDQRKTALAFTFRDRKIFLLNGKYTNKIGVIKKTNDNQCFEYTDLERTLIDIAVRPVYAGGVFEVLEAYEKAKNNINPEKLLEYLEKINFIYPYHQVIGFYLEKAGYQENDLKLFDKKSNLKFYLTYNMRNKDFSNRWQLYFPKGF